MQFLHYALAIFVSYLADILSKAEFYRSGFQERVLIAARSMAEN